MIKLQLFAFVLRWLASSIGMYLCLLWWGHLTAESGVNGEHGWLIFAVAGLIFSVLNSVLKPLIKLLTLPLAIFTLGLSTVIINTLIVLLTIHLLPGVEMDVWGAVWSSVVLSVINGVLNFLIS